MLEDEKEEEKNCYEIVGDFFVANEVKASDRRK